MPLEPVEGADAFDLRRMQGVNMLSSVARPLRQDPVRLVKLGGELVLGYALRMAKRRGRIDASMLTALPQDLSGIEFIQDERTSRNAWSQSLTLSLKNRLKLCDASYPALALRLDAKLATLDARLVAAAELESVELAL